MHHRVMAGVYKSILERCFCWPYSRIIIRMRYKLVSCLNFGFDIAAHAFRTPCAAHVKSRVSDVWCHNNKGSSDTFW
jgi:hypothetical protein